MKPIERTDISIKKGDAAAQSRNPLNSVPKSVFRPRIPQTYAAPPGRCDFKSVVHLPPVIRLVLADFILKPYAIAKS